MDELNLRCNSCGEDLEYEICDGFIRVKRCPTCIQKAFFDGWNEGEACTIQSPAPERSE